MAVAYELTPLERCEAWSCEEFAAVLIQAGYARPRLTVNCRVVTQAWQDAVVEAWLYTNLRNQARYALLPSSAIAGVDATV